MTFQKLFFVITGVIRKKYNMYSVVPSKNIKIVHYIVYSLKRITANEVIKKELMRRKKRVYAGKSFCPACNVTIDDNASTIHAVTSTVVKC